MDALPLEFDDSGTGRPVVLLHPFPLNRFFWRPMVGALGGRVRTIAPDYRGFGDSPARAPFSMDSYADDIIAVLDRLQIEKATFFGVSMGGYVAFSLWRRHPGRVSALILAHTKAEPDNDTQAAARRTNVKLVLSGGAQQLVPRMFQGMVGITTHADRPLVATAVRVGMESAPRQGTLGALEGMLKRPDSVPTLKTITVPTLILSGEEDTLTPPENQATLHAGIKGSTLVSIPNVGHLGPIELPEVVARVVETFVQGLPR